MKGLSLYQDRDTIIHKIDPISKIIYIAVVILIPIIIPYKIVGIIGIIMSLLILLKSKTLKQTLPLIGFSLIILISIVVIQGLFRVGNKTPFFTIGSIIFYKEGLLFAFNICIRVLNILCSICILILTAKPTDIVETLVRKGLSPRIGYMLLSVLQIIPQMSATMGKIVDAQRSRGMETEGKLITRIKAFFPLIGPVVMNSLVNTRERSMALEVRAFNSSSKRTYLNEETDYAFNKGIRVVLVVMLILSVTWRVIKCII